MTTAVDSNILLDVVLPGAPHKEGSMIALAEALREGDLVICEAVFAEVSPRFGTEIEARRFFDETGVLLRPSGAAALYLAGGAWRGYAGGRPSGIRCPQCGVVNDLSCRSCAEPVRVRQHVIADFLIGAHAQMHAGTLLTRDRGYYSTYFPELKLVG